MSQDYALAELERLFANLLRIGSIEDLDELHKDGPRVTVDLGDLVTDWLPFFTRRAGPDSDWAPPEPGEQVMILSPYGDLGQGVVLPAIYQDAHPAPASARTVRRVQFADGSSVQYDRAAHVLTVDVGSGSVVVNCATATINASESVTMDTPEGICTGNFTVKKRLTYQGGMSGSNNQGGPTATIQGGMNLQAGNLTLTGGEVSADGIGLKGHHHTAQGANADTTTAKA